MSAYSQIIRRQGPVLYLPFTEPVGAAGAVDLSQYGRNATVTALTRAAFSNPNFTTRDREDQSPSWGAGSDVQVPAATWVPTTAITITCWLYAVAGVSNYFVNYQAGPINAHTPWSDGNVYWDFGNGGSNRLGFATPAGMVGAWHHHAMVARLSPAFMAYYMDAVLKASQAAAATSAVVPTSVPLYIGRSTGAERLNGRMHHFAMFDRVLSVDEIAAQVASAPYVTGVTY